MIESTTLDLETTKGNTTFEIRHMNGDRANYVWMRLTREVGAGLSEALTSHNWVGFTKMFSEDLYNYIKTEVLYSVTATHNDLPLDDKKRFNSQAQKELGQLFPGKLSMKIFEMMGKVMYDQFDDRLQNFIDTLVTKINLEERTANLIKDKLKENLGSSKAANSEPTPG